MESDFAFLDILSNPFDTIVVLLLAFMCIFALPLFSEIAAVSV